MLQILEYWAKISSNEGITFKSFKAICNFLSKFINPNDSKSFSSILYFCDNNIFPFGLQLIDTFENNNQNIKTELTVNAFLNLLQIIFNANKKDPKIIAIKAKFGITNFLSSLYRIGEKTTETIQSFVQSFGKPFSAFPLSSFQKEFLNENFIQNSNAKDELLNLKTVLLACYYMLLYENKFSFFPLPFQNIKLF